MYKHFFKKVSINVLSFLLVIALMAPNTLTPIVAETPLEPGGISLVKTATPTPGFVNTWDIEVNFQSRNHKKSADIILVMDVSGSMDNNDRLVKTKEAAILFVDKLLTETSYQTRIALVTYSTDSNTVSDFVDYTGASNLKAKINALNANGATNMQAGMRRARTVMAQSTADNKTIIFLSDGEPTVSYRLKAGRVDGNVVDWGGDKLETKRGIPVDDYDSDALGGNGNTGFRSDQYYGANNNAPRSPYYFNHGNAVLNESDTAKAGPLNAVIYTVALDLTGQAGTLMKNIASSSNHAFVAGSDDLEGIYSEIAGGISNNTSNVIINDQIGPGFQLVPNTITADHGTPTAAGDNIYWHLGNPTSEYFTGVLRYRIIAVDSILDVPGTPGLPYDTNDRTYMSYTDNKGFNQEFDANIPTVVPTFFSFNKVLLDDLQEEVEGGGYLFKLNTSGPHAFNRDDDLTPQTKVRTVEIYPYGTYTVSEVSGTKDGNPLDLNFYTTVTKVNDVVSNQFTLGDNSRGNVDVEVSNTDKRTSILSGFKSFTDTTGDEHAQAGEVLYYTLTLKNTGEGRAKNVIIKDTLSDLLPHLDETHTTTVKLYKLGETTPFATHTRQELINGFTVDIGANTEIRAEFDVKIRDDFNGKDVPKLRNIATIFTDEPEVEIPTIFPVISSSKVMKNITSPGTDYVIPGDQIKVTLNIQNTGKQGDRVFIKDALTDMLPYLNNPSGAAADVFVDGVYIHSTTVGNLMSGINMDIGANQEVEIVFVLNVKADLVVDEVVTLTNIAIIGEDEPTDEIDLKSPKIESYKKAREASGDGYVQSGELVSYEIGVSNSGNATSRAITIKDTLSEIIEYFDIPNYYPIQTTKGNYKLADLINGFDIILEPGESFTITFSLTTKSTLGDLINEEKILRNIVLVNDDEHEVELPFGDRGVTGSKNVRGDQYESIVFAGEYLNYEIKVWNTKDLKFEDVIVKDTLSIILPYLEAHDGEVVTITSNKGQVFGDYTVADLKSGIMFDVDVNEIITLNFRVKTLSTLDKNEIAALNNVVLINNQEHEATIPVGNKGFTVKKNVLSAHKSTYAVPGHDLYYEIIIENTGDATYENISIKDGLDFIIDMVDDPRTNTVTMMVGDDVMPALLTLSDIINGYTFNIEPGEFVTFLFTVTVKDDLAFNKDNIMHNLVTVNEKEADADIQVRDVLLNHNKLVKDSNGDGLASSGETLHYEILLGNSGNLDAEDVVIKDTLSALIPYIEDYATDAIEFDSNVNGTHNTYKIQDLIDGITLDLAAGEFVSLKFSVTLKDDAVAQLKAQQIDTLVNTALLNDVPVDEEIPAEDPSFLLDKLVEDDSNDGLAEAGEKLHYEIQVVNNSLVNADLVTVQDTLSELLPYIDDPSAVVVYINSGTQDTTITMAQLQAGYTTSLEAEDTLSITFTLTVRADLRDVLEANTNLTNTAMINDEPVEETIPTILPDINASKTMTNVTDQNADYVMPGDTLRVTLEMENIGDAKGVVKVQDSLADLLPYIEDPSSLMASVIRDGVAAANVSVADLMAGDVEFTILPDETIIIIFDLVILDSLVVEEEIILTNTALIGDEDPGTEIPLKSPKVTGDKQATEASGDGYVQSGETISYTIWAKNSGTGPARAVHIQDELTDLIDFVGIDPTLVLNTSKGTYTLGDLMAGFDVRIEVDEEFKIQFDLIAKDNLREIIGEDRFLRNVAYINGTEEEVELPFGDRGVDGRKTVWGESSDEKVFAGEEMYYQIQVWNTKDLLFEDVIVKDTLSLILPYIEAHDDTPLEITTTGTQTFSDYTIADLKAGLLLDVDVDETITINFTVRLKENLTKEDVTFLNNVVAINELDRDASIPLGERSMTLDKHVSSAHESGYAVPGYDVNYEIIVKNTGEGDYVDLTLTDTLDKILPMIDDPRSSILTVQYTNNGVAETPFDISVEDLVDGYQFTLEVDVSVSFKFTVRVKDDLDVFEHTTMMNTATIGNHETEAEIMTRNTKFFIEKSVSDANEDGYASSGETLYYHIRFGNEGNLDAYEILVRDTLENLIPYIEDYKSNEIIFDSNINGSHNMYTIEDLISGISVDLEAGEVVTLDFEVTLKEDAVAKLTAADIDTLVNTATIDEIPDDGTIEVDDPTLEMNKRVSDANDDGFAEADELLNYEIRVENTGRAASDEVIVKDTLSELLPYIQDPSEVEVKVVGRYIDTTITMAELQAGFTTHLLGGEVMTFRFTLRVRADLKEVLEEDIALRNVAMINDVPTETEIPTKLPKITALKTVRDTNGDGLVQKGETLFYEIHVENVGEVDALNVWVQDDLKYLEGLVIVDEDQVLHLDGVPIEATIKDLMNGLALNVEAGKTAKLSFSVKVDDKLDFDKAHIFENKATVDKLEVGTKIDSEITPKVNPPKELPQTGVSTSYGYIGAGTLLLLGAYIIIRKGFFKKED